MPRNAQTKCDQQVLPVAPVPKVSFLSRKEARKCRHLTSDCLDSNDRTNFVTIPGEMYVCLQHTDDPNYLTKSDNLSLDTCFLGLMSYDYFWVRLLLGKFVLICRKRTRFQISDELYEIVRRAKRPMIIVKLTFIGCSGSNRSAFYLYRETGADLSNNPL